MSNTGAHESIDLPRLVGGDAERANGLFGTQDPVGSDEVIIDLTGDELAFDLRDQSRGDAALLQALAAPPAAIPPIEQVPVRQETAPVIEAPVAPRQPAKQPAPVAEAAPVAPEPIQTRVGTAAEPEPERRFFREPLQARRVYRIIRRVDGWSVLKVSAIFYTCVWLVLLTSGLILWGGAVQSGTVDNVENLIATLLGFETFLIDGEVLFRVALVGGLTAVVAATAFSVLMAVLFNLISDLTGGIRVTVIQEESARRQIR